MAVRHWRIVISIILIAVVLLAFAYYMGWLDKWLKDNDPVLSTAGGYSTNVTTLKNMEVNFLNVGQGDCIIIELPDGKNMIIDSGKHNSCQDVITDFVAFCEDFILVGHNIMFDYKFTKRYANLSGLAFEKQGIDTLRIARKVHKEMESKSLGNLCEYYHIENQATHRAYHDALAAAKVYHMLAHEFEQEFQSLFKPEILQYRPRKVQACTEKQVEYLKALCKYHNLPIEENIREMSRSEMSKKIDAIISNCGMMRLDEKR